MPGETGSPVNGGNHENEDGAISQAPQTESPTTSTRLSQVNVVCSTCGQVPSQGSKQYIGLSADGYSNNVYGDVHNHYCCLHCAHQSGDTFGEWHRRSESSRDAASSQSSTRQLSRSQTIETLPSISERIARPVSRGEYTVASNGSKIPATTGNHNTGGPGAGSDSPALSLIGLKAIRKSSTHSDDWQIVHSVNADYTRLKIDDAYISEEKLQSKHEYPFVPLSRDWDSCVVSLEAHRQTGFRRLKIEEGDTCEVWLPNTRVQVAFDEPTVSMRFSNCNKLQPPGNYRTQDGAATCVTTYHPEKPNVVFEVGFATADAANTFRTHILRRSMLDTTPDSPFIQQSPQITMTHSSLKTASGDEKPCILVWKQAEGTQSDSTIEVHDMIALSDRLDLDIAVVDKRVEITIGYVDRLTYYPAFDQPDLPQNVKRTLDGAPTKSAVEGGDSSRSRICLTSTPTEARNLLNFVFSRTLSWKLEAIFHQLGVKMSSSKRLKFGSTSYAAQLTLWSNPGSPTICMTMRTTGKSNFERKSITDGEEVEWFSISFKGGQDRPTAELKQNVLTIKKVDCEKGNCLSTSDLRPLDADTKSETDSSSSSSTSKAIELKFSSAEQVQQFREVVTEQFLDVTDG